MGIDGIDKLINDLEQMSINAQSLNEHNLNINVEYIKEHIHEFNVVFKSDITAEISDDDLTEIVSDTFIEYVGNNLTSRTKPIESFNQVYKPFARVD